MWPSSGARSIFSPEGFAILRLMARQAGVDRPFDEVKAQLAARVAREKRTKDFDAYVKGLREGAGIKINDAELEKISVGGAAPAQPGADVARP